MPYKDAVKQAMVQLSKLPKQVSVQDSTKQWFNQATLPFV
jgi:hypothetical protein